MRITSKFRDQLVKMADRIRNIAADLEEHVRSSSGGDAGGGLSNSPMHLGDIGSEIYSQQLSATLLENEEYLLNEINAAIIRIDGGNFGKCENCGKSIVAARLDAIPYTRHCTPCATVLQDGSPSNLNIGRSQFESLPDTESETPNDHVPLTKYDSLAGRNHTDNHAVGTAGGGTAVGGLAGSTVGAGNPSPDLDAATASSRFDATFDSDSVKLKSINENTHNGTSARKRPSRSRARKTKAEKAPSRKKSTS